MNDSFNNIRGSLLRFTAGRNHLLLLCLLCLLFVACNIVWFLLGGSPQHWDSSVHLFESLNAARIGENSAEGFFRQALNISWYYPPFVSYASIPLYALLGQSEFSGLLTMTAFLLVMVVSVYLAGARMYSRNAGLLAATLIACSPVVIEFSRTFMLDLPLAALATLAVYLLLKSDSFRDRTPSIYLGLILGAGVLTKWTFPVFVIIPFFLSALAGLRDRSHRGAAALNICLALLLGGAIAAPWYVTHLIQILSGRSGELGRGELTFLGSLFYYLGEIPDQVSWIGAIIIVTGGFLLLKDHWRTATLPLLWFAGGYVLITLIGFKQPRFSIALLPPLAIIAGAGIESLKTRAPRLGWKVFMIPAGLMLLQYLLITFIPAESAAGSRLAGTRLFAPAGPERSDWKHAEILDAAERDFRSRSTGSPVLRIVPDYPYFNAKTFEYFAALTRHKVVIAGISGFPLFTDYVILKTGDLGDRSDDKRRSNLQASLIADTSSSSALFSSLGAYELPDGSQALLLRTSPKSIPGTSGTDVVEKLRACTDQFVRRFIKPSTGYRLSVDEYSEEETRQGHIKSLRIMMEEGELGDYAFNSLGVAVHAIDFELGDIVFDPATLLKRDTLQLLSMRRMAIHGLTLRAADLKKYIETSSRGKTTIDEIAFAGGAIRLAMHQQNLNAGIRV